MILLVVDMQAKKFSTASHAWLLENVAREVRDAKAAGWGVVFLEYTRGVGKGGVDLAHRTHDSLTQIVADYGHAITVHKEHDDGSAEVLHAADDWWNDAGAEHIRAGIRVVGVNTEACVAGTVNGLASSAPDVEITVVGDACNGQQEAYDGSPAPNNAGQDRIVTEGRRVRVLQVA